MYLQNSVKKSFNKYVKNDICFCDLGSGFWDLDLSSLSGHTVTNIQTVLSASALPLKFTGFLNEQTILVRGSTQITLDKYVSRGKLFRRKKQFDPTDHRISIRSLLQECRILARFLQR